MVERAKKRREDAPEIGDIKLLSPEEARSYFPLLSEDYGAVYVSGGARVDGRAMRDSLIRGAEKNGATVMRGSAQILTDGYYVIGAEVNGEKLLANQVIDTSGAWSKQLLQPLGLTFQVTHQRAQIIHLRYHHLETGGWPVVMPPNNSYLLTFDDNKIVVGATRTDEVEFDYRNTTAGIHEMLGKALEVAPGLDDSSVIETRVALGHILLVFFRLLVLYNSLMGYS